MSDAPALVLSAVGGAALGALFFGGLWWTVQRAVSSDRPALWFLGGWVVRAAATVAGFLAVSRGHPSRLLACLLGFVVVRVLATWLGSPLRPSRRTLRSEAADAS